MWTERALTLIWFGCYVSSARVGATIHQIANSSHFLPTFISHFLYAYGMLRAHKCISVLCSIPRLVSFKVILSCLPSRNTFGYIVTESGTVHQSHDQRSFHCVWSPNRDAFACMVTEIWTALPIVIAWFTSLFKCTLSSRIVFGPPTVVRHFLTVNASWLIGRPAVIERFLTVNTISGHSHDTKSQQSHRKYELHVCWTKIVVWVWLKL